MEYFTELIGKQVISIFDQKIIGTLYNIDIDWHKKRVRSLLILSQDDEAIYSLSPQKIFNTNDCITIRNNADLIISADPNPARIIGKTIIGLSGKNYGTLNEIAFENWKPQLLYSLEPIDISKIFGFSQQLVLINDLDKKVYLHNFLRKKMLIPLESNQTVSILNSSNSIGIPKTITAKSTKS